ncbi:hypothetical protein [Spiroplasma endosymbiont of Polydrusus pterygomalis]|uniref:hypothetical protein n=1 Tax=Spiroplasma endosymbiont of Polydrusus pterygomalis TaxID=3139327 RepID=UPI003CCB7347
MRFLDTDIQINSETIFSLLKPVIPSPLTTGLLCLAGGISYYSWNYYKNKKQELNANFVPKNNKESKIKQIKSETSINDIKNIITNNKSNINKKEKLCEDKINLAKTEEETVWDENNLVVAKERQEEIIKINVSVIEQEIEGFTEMDLDEAEEEIMLDDINNDDDNWEMLSISSNSSNCL